MRGLRWAMLAVALGLAIGCAAGCAGPSTGTRAAMLIVAYPQGLREVALDGTAGRLLVAAGSGGSTPGAPAVSPDGRTIAYLVAPAPGAADVAADVWLADRDGGHRRRLLVHQSPGHSYRSPGWLDDRTLLVVLDLPATCDGCNAATTTTPTLEKVDSGTGQATVVRAPAVEWAATSDGRRLAVVDTSVERGAALDITPLGDGAATEIVGLDRGFAEITTPRFRPAGTAIAFAAAQNRRVRAGAVFVTRAAFGPLPSPLPDGLPEDVWLVDADGGGLRLIAPLRESRPAIAWSPDGATLYVAGAVALHRIDVATGTDTHIGAGAPQPGIAFAPAAGSN